MTDQNRIIPTPPPELVDKWNNLPLSTQEIITIAWRHGADQELKACCQQLEELQHGTCYPLTGDKLHDARRPKPPSLADEALETVERISGSLDPCIYQDDADWDTIRRALQQLKQLQGEIK